ncbi:MAG TPA: hypothetical protein VMF64_00420 [Steroidobacteraceae bacterium]|nr:hypothetical protein [Steroidobacteraceae bacterium]
MATLIKRKKRDDGGAQLFGSDQSDRPRCCQVAQYFYFGQVLEGQFLQIARHLYKCVPQMNSIPRHHHCGQLSIAVDLTGNNHIRRSSSGEYFS